MRAASKTKMIAGSASLSIAAAVIAICGFTATQPASSSELPYFCTHNGDIYDVVFGTQPCPEYIHTDPEQKHDSSHDPDCVTGRQPGWV